MIHQGSAIYFLECVRPTALGEQINLFNRQIKGPDREIFCPRMSQL